MLAAVPRLLHLRVSQQFNRCQQLRTAHVPRLLLASHGQLYGQSYNLLLDESEVSMLLPGKMYP